jgi:N-acetyl-beta-hexosaminidase
MMKNENSSRWKGFLLPMMIVVGIGCFQKNISASELSLIPWPQQIDIKEEKLLIKRNLLLVNPSGDSDIEQIINTCSNDFREIGFNVDISGKEVSNTRGKTQILFFIESSGSNNYGEEGYKLEVGDNISVYVTSSTGLFWGSRTVLQLLKQGPGFSIPKMDISDQPVVRYRGLMIDVARSFHSLEFHLEMIKKMAYYKLNHYMIHFSDHQSYTLPSDIYPGLPTPGRYYSKDDIIKMVDMAKEYHVNIVPSVDVPGHSGALIRGIPELAFNGEQKLDVTKERTYEILQNIFGELMELFPGPVWHLGADEVGFPDLKDSPDEYYANWMKKHNFSKGSQLLNYFINRMHDFIKGKGYQMFVWEGFKPDLYPKVNNEIIVCPFDVMHEGIMPEDYMSAGYKLLNTSWTPLYVADKIYMTTPEIMARWNMRMFGAGRSPQPFAYWKKFSPDEIITEVVGGQMCSWANEEKAEWGMLFGSDAGPGFSDYGRPGPRVQIFSERVWTGDKTSAEYLLERAGVSYWE